MFSERIYEKMYNGSRSRPALARGITQADESRRRGVIMEAIAGIDIAVWDVKAQALGIPLYQALGATRTSVRGYASGGWAPGDEAEAELARNDQWRCSRHRRLSSMMRGHFAYFGVGGNSRRDDRARAILKRMGPASTNQMARERGRG